MATEVQSPAAAAGAGDPAPAIAWTNPTNVFASDNSRATATLASGESTDRLLVTDFGFTAVTGTVGGIEVSIERRSTTGGTVDAKVQLTKNGTAGVGDDKADGVTGWPAGTDGTATYGGGADLWGTTWTAAEITASTFGVVIAASYSGLSDTAEIDHVSVTVTYTAAGGGAAVAMATRRMQRMS